MVGIKKRISRIAGYFKRLEFPPFTSNKVAAGKKDPVKNGAADAKSAKDRELADVGLDAKKVGEHKDNKPEADREIDARDQADAVNDAADTTQTESDVVASASSAAIESGAKNNGVITKADLKGAYDRGFAQGKQKAIDDYKAANEADRARMAQEAQITRDGVDDAGVIKRSLAGMWVMIKKIRLAYALKLAMLAALAYFGYKLGIYGQCMKQFREDYADVLGWKEGDVESEFKSCIVKYTPAGTAPAVVSFNADQICPRILLSGTQAPTALLSSDLPSECTEFARRWCRLQQAEEALQVCENEMPLSGLLNGALEFLQNAALAVLQTTLQVVEKAVPVILDGVEQIAGAAVGSLLDSGTLLMLAVAAVVVFLFLRRRR
jgi:hypothetical protein